MSLSSCKLGELSSMSVTA